MSFKSAIAKALGIQTQEETDARLHLALTSAIYGDSKPEITLNRSSYPTY